MKPYKVFSQCAACGTTMASSQFQAAGKYPNESSKDRVKRVCQNCSYVWYEAPRYGVEIQEDPPEEVKQKEEDVEPTTEEEGEEE